MLLPKLCSICGAVGESPCAGCLRELVRAPLLPAPPQVDAMCSLLAYEGVGRELVARLKYRNARSPLRWLATRMAEQVRAANISVDVVTWLPTSAERRRERGFDQAELLARAVASRLHRPCRSLLVRAPGVPQTGRTAHERRAGPPLRARAVRRASGAVLLVDDVVTTGASVTAAARVLRAAGARTVAVASAARTPPPRE